MHQKARADEPLQAEVNFGVVGHVDHGKTSLVAKLTGTWTDTHSEELKRGISIRLGYADAVFRKCTKCNGIEAYTTSEKCTVCGEKAKVLRKVSFVDAPGHETLMTTMLSGAALMHGAILVIAANEPCPQPRTAEHLMAIRMAGIENIVVAQNKVDLVEREKAVENYMQIKKFLEDNNCGNAEIIPVAAHFGANIDALIEAIEKNIPTPEFDINKPLKMYVARSFDINKPGAKPEEMKGGVIGGSIAQGSISEGDEIELSPGLQDKKIMVKAVSLSTASEIVKSAKPGGLIAVGTLLDPSMSKNDQLRGQVAGKPGTLPEGTKAITLEVHKVKRLLDDVEDVKANDTVVLTVGTMTAVGTAAKKLSGGKFGFELKNSVVIEKGQKVAISKRINNVWRLAAYGVAA